ncbi:MAG: exodeoxyribonuclease V subunit gamma [Saprospiraceae bacterium]|nr:exodeoxyribonuclease V subunit gamma [Saprospiraceae bacterium]
MGLNVYISNDLERLVSKLNERSEYLEKQIFQKDHFIVQTEGLRRWLSVQMAINSGVFANFHFTPPNSLIYDLFGLAKMQMPELFTTNNFKWLIYNILSNTEFKNLFPEITAYYENDNIKQLQLATKLSDLFDQYTFFRPDYILNWNNDTDNGINRKYIYHEKWQKWIWRKIRELLTDKIHDRVEMFFMLLNALKDDEDLKSKIRTRYPRLTVFGFSSISQLHINVLVEMSKHTSDIDFYLFSPAPEEYWLHDIPEKTKLRIERYFKINLSGLNLEAGNRLLMDLGKTARYFYLMIFNNEEFLNNLDNESLVSKPGPNSMLKIIQNEIYNNITDKNRIPPDHDIIFDGSVNISSHYSVGREVEALYNYLLEILEDTSVKPHDIIIQTANIDKYVPYIISVFENGKYKIPYTIADRSYHGVDNMIGILEKILNLREDEFTSEQIFRLIQFKPVRDKFDFKDLELLRIIIHNANIRNGIFGEKADETHIVSWKNGLERIVLGFAVNSEQLMEIPGQNYENLPLGFIENEFASEGLKLVGFVNFLIDFIRERKTNRSLNMWKDFIQTLINDVFVFKDTDSDILNYINERLSFPPVIETFSGNDISYDIFVSAFLESIYQDTRKGSFFNGNITFCSMTPMRSIPFRIVAVLGLDYNSFPRKNDEVLFDLMNAEHRPGDRNNKESDKFLFLEAIMSAREKLYLSYLGQDSKTNVEKPPSSVIDSLIDYIFFFETDHNLRKKFITRHPLHNFNSKYFNPLYPQLFTYNEIKTKNINDNYLNIDNSTKDNEINEISLTDLVSFYKNSIEWYYRKTLKIDYRENEILIPETELFEINNLQKYNLSYSLLEISDEPELEKFILKEKIKGNLPLKSAGTVTVNNILEEIKQLKSERFKLTSGNKPENVDIEFDISSDILLTGTVQNIYDDKMIIVDLSKNYAKRLVQLQITRLVIALKHPEICQFILINSSDNKIKKIVLQAIDTKTAEKELKFLIDIFLEYNHNMLIFTADAGFEMYNAKGNTRIIKSPEEKFVESLKKKSEYDNYLQKFLEFEDEDAIIGILKNDHNPVNKLIEMFFNY